MNLAKTTFRMLSGLIVALVGLTALGQQIPDLIPQEPDRPPEARVARKPASLPVPQASPARTASQPLSSPKVAPQLPAAAMLPVPRSEGMKVEPVTERYPNGNPKVERQVILDAAGNYINQGTYTMYGPDGKVLKTGEFQHGKQEGKWTQNLAKDEGQLFSAEQQKEFASPFVSEATFVDGKMQGPWTIKDRDAKKIIEWNFENAVRHGTWTWWHSNGQKWLEATYRNGSLNGELLEWDRDGKIASQSTYIDGRVLAKVVGWHALGQKHFEGAYLRVQSVPEPVYDWWTGTATSTPAPPTGQDQKHGVWIGWYRNGNKKTEGQYDRDLPTGKFTWWYENGQKQAEGEYEAGVRSGEWFTWHANGLKESQAAYVNGKLIGTWMRWDAEGKMVGTRDFNIEHPSPNAKTERANTSQRPGTTTRSR
jgi:antitoxin component YwqK of YwqJK toxin-antitoxin module